MFTVDDMMTRSPHTLFVTHTLSDAKRMMDSKRIRHIPIVGEKNAIMGLVTQRDILAAQSSSLAKSTGDDSEMEASLVRFTDRMLYSVSPCAGLKEAAIYMQKHKIGCLPVVDDNKLAGIITDSDFVTIAINLLEIQQDSEPPEVDSDDVA